MTRAFYSADLLPGMVADYSFSFDLRDYQPQRILTSSYMPHETSR